MTADLQEPAAPSEGQQRFERVFLAVGLSLLVHFCLVLPDLMWSVSTPAREARIGALAGAGPKSLTVHIESSIVIENQPEESAKRHVATDNTQLAGDQPTTSAPGALAAAEAGLRPSPLPDLPVGRQFYRASELDERPRPRTQVEPEFPLVVDPGVVGVVVARLFINDEGRVERVLIEQSTPAGLFEEAVHKAFLGAQYTPGMRKGRAVAAQIRIEIEFRSNPLK